MPDQRVDVAAPFISYSRTDSAFALTLRGALADAGRDPWIDIEDIPPSTDWEAEIRQAIVDAAAVIFLLSRASTQSDRCRNEIDLAVESGKRIVPARPRTGTSRRRSGIASSGRFPITRRASLTRRRCPGMFIVACLAVLRESPTVTQFAPKRDTNKTAGF